MSYIVRNGRVLKPLYTKGGTSFWDCGPASPITVFDKAVSIMANCERRGDTTSHKYRYARNVAYRYI